MRVSTWDTIQETAKLNNWDNSIWFGIDSEKKFVCLFYVFSSYLKLRYFAINKQTDIFLLLNFREVAVGQLFSFSSASLFLIFVYFLIVTVLLLIVDFKLTSALNQAQIFSTLVIWFWWLTVMKRLQQYFSFCSPLYKKFSFLDLNSRILIYQLAQSFSRLLKQIKFFLISCGPATPQKSWWRRTALWRRKRELGNTIARGDHCHQ